MRCPLSSLDVATSSEMFLLTTWSLPQNHGYRNEPGKGFYETWFDIYRTRLGTICLFSWPKGGVFLAASAWESLGVKPVKPYRPAPFRYVSNCFMPCRRYLKTWTFARGSAVRVKIASIRKHVKKIPDFIASALEGLPTSCMGQGMLLTKQRRSLSASRRSSPLLNTKN